MIKKFKQQAGSIYVYIIILFAIALLLLNSLIIKINHPIENNNLYYWADCAANNSLSVLNKIISVSLQEQEKTQEEFNKILESNIKKYLGSQKEIILNITSAPRDYKIKINFEFDLEYNCEVLCLVQDTKNNNKLKINSQFIYGEKEFYINSYRLIN